METESKRYKILKSIFFILLFILVLEFGIISCRKIKNKKYLSLNDAELTAKLITTKYIFDIPYTEEELLKHSPEEQLKLIGDEYSQYLTEVEYEKRENSHNFKFVGLGFRSLQIDDGYFEILEVLPNSPVEEAGLKSGDKILKIDGNSIKDMSILETINLIEEKNVKDTILTIQRDTKIFDVLLTRRFIKGNPVISEMIDNEIGYIKLVKFSSDSGEQFINELSFLMGKNMTKLILDLRGNPGGDADQIVPVASALLDNSINQLFTIKDKNGKYEKYNRDRDMLFSGPLVVLCNENTASAGEVLISLLKDYNRCTTVGKKTFGKQVSQEIIPLNSKNKLVLSTGMSIPPKKEIYHKIGIKPDFGISSDQNGKDKQMNKAIEILKG